MARPLPAAPHAPTLAIAWSRCHCPKIRGCPSADPRAADFESQSRPRPAHDDPLAMRPRLSLLGYRALNHIRPELVERAAVGKYAIANVRPLRLASSADRFAAGARVSTPGLDLRQADQEALVREIGLHADLFLPIRSDPSINPQHHDVADRIRNGFFPTPDAETYAAMIAILRPRRIIEIGGGFSTLVARSTIDQEGLSTELIVVDPEPRTQVSAAASRVVRQPVERSGITEADFQPPSILFIDSSHILRAGGDLPFLYGLLVPSLPPGVTVHVHDIYLPFEYSGLGLDLWWTEQYLLQALLSHTSRYRIDLALRWMSAVSPAHMADVFGDIVLTDSAHGGTSFWFTVV